MDQFSMWLYRHEGTSAKVLVHGGVFEVILQGPWGSAVGTGCSLQEAALHAIAEAIGV